MNAVAAILSIILFLIFATSGLQKIRFNPMMSQSAQHLGFSKASYQRLGVVEILGAIGLLAGLSSTPGNFWGVVNWLAAGGFVLLMLGAIYFHRRAGDKFAVYGMAIALGLLSAVELVLRLTY
jgi:uncharacterized membrane protein YphA (DoxX/SURF4 family)